MTRSGLIALLAAASWSPFLSGQPQDLTLHSTVPLVLAPATVTDRKGRHVPGLTSEDLVLYDDNVPQQAQLEEAFQPISLVLAVQSSINSAAAVFKVRRIPSLLQPLVTGEGGEVAVLAFNDAVRVIEGFTSDAGATEAAVNTIEPDGVGGSAIDAVSESLKLLATRPRNRRKVVLLVSEKRDRTSRNQLEEVLYRAQKDNVTVYALTYSPFLTAFTARPKTYQVPKKDGTGMEEKNEVQPADSMNLLALLTELRQLHKAETGTAFAQYTGGREISFLRKQGLEEALGALGDELHSQYLLSYMPRPPVRPGFHTLRLTVKGRSELSARTRTGYWAVE